MKSLQYLIIIIIALLFRINCFGDSTLVNDCTINERLIIKTDRNVYVAGEKILISIDYSLISPNSLKDFSKILYVELINLNNNQSVVKKIYKIIDSNVNGEFEIPNEAQTGNYILISYTQFQKNFTQTFNGGKTISIFNPEHIPQETKSLSDIDTIIIVPHNSATNLDRFLRSFVIYIPSRYLKPRTQFMVFYKDNSIGTHINPDNMGLYKLDCANLIPEKIMIIDNANDTVIKKFPDIKQNKILTSLNIVNEDYTYRIKTNGNNADFKLTILNSYLNEIFCENIKIDSAYKIGIHQTKFTDGINYFILQDLQKNVVDFKSLILNRKAQEILVTSKDSFTTKELGHFQFKLKDKSPSDLPFVSIAVVRKNSQNSSSDFIPTHHLIHPCILQDFIRQCNIHDENTLSNISTIFDNNLEPDLIKEIIPKSILNSLRYMPEIRDFTIKGSLNNVIDNNPIPNAEIGISVLKNNPQIHFSKTNDLGEFFFTLDDLYDENQIFLTLLADQEKYEGTKITLFSPFINELPKINNSPFFFDERKKDFINDLYINHQITKAFSNVNHYKTINNRLKDSLLNIAEPRYIISLNDYVKLESIKELFNGIVPFVKIRNIEERDALKIFDENGKMFSGEPLILIDNIPFYDFESIKNIEIQQIKSIEVINRQYVLGNYILNGIVHIRTYSKNFANFKISKTSVFSNIQCAEEPRECIFPKINNNKENLPDYRTVLFWNPKIKLKNDYQELDFFTSDLKGLYDIIVIGYDESGNTFSGKKQILID